MNVSKTSSHSVRAIFYAQIALTEHQWALSAFNLCATGQHRLIPPATQLNSPKAHEAKGSDCRSAGRSILSRRFESCQSHSGFLLTRTAQIVVTGAKGWHDPKPTGSNGYQHLPHQP